MSLIYQCLLFCSRPGLLNRDILLAASGASIHTFNASDGAHLSTWPARRSRGTSRQTHTDSTHDAAHSPRTSADCDNSQRPQKRRKLSSASSGSSAEIIVHNGIGNAEGSGVSQISDSPITKLACDSSGQHIVALTGEDKALRVYDLSIAGALSLFSERLMPKRPCAIVVTPDDSTILCADKFGDVYALPLLGRVILAQKIPGDASVAETKEESQAFSAPSATTLTVHSKRNRKALRQQQQHKQAKAENKDHSFDHQLILGHVSLLTDVICATAATSQKPRKYILTADRDEHIRVSRGIPQAHIIENFLLGHKEFVSRLRILPAHPHLLLSGGGDDFLLLWNWRLGIIQQKLDLRRHVERFKSQYRSDSTDKTQPTMPLERGAMNEATKGNIAVSNIVAIDTKSYTQIVVTCEGVPALFVFSLGNDATMTFESTFPVEGNVIDVVFIKSQSTVLCSLDTVHVPFSTIVEENTPRQTRRPSMSSLVHSSIGWEKVSSHSRMLIDNMEGCLHNDSGPQDNRSDKGRSMRELLYNIESLRKRDSED